MWPGAVHWPDFLDNPSTQRWWTRWLRQVKEDVGAIDGVWLDMNEVIFFHFIFRVFFFLRSFVRASRGRVERKKKTQPLSFSLSFFSSPGLQLLLGRHLPSSALPKRPQQEAATRRGSAQR
jgi:alpha-glucosidase (family GH31 glycosyl hydrolase)